MALKIPRSIRTAAKFFGAGNATLPFEWSATSKNGLGFWFKSLAASGDSRGMYLRLYLAGAGDGEAARIFTTVQAASATAHGAHISLGFGVSPAALSGLGAAVRGTLHIPNRAVTLGTVAGIQGEVYMDGTSSNPTATRLVLFRGIVDGGDATAQNKLTHVMDLVNLGAAVFGNQSAWSVSKVLKIAVNGTDYYLPLSTAA